MEVRMHKISSGVIAISFIAGMFGGCSESPESGLTPPAEGDSTATSISEWTKADSLQGISSGAVVDDFNTYSSSGFLTASSSDNVLAISSSSDELATHSSSSSGTEFSYIAPANFTDTVNGVFFDMVHVPGGSYIAGATTAPNRTRFTKRPRTGLPSVTISQQEPKSRSANGTPSWAARKTLGNQETPPK